MTSGSVEARLAEGLTANVITPVAAGADVRQKRMTDTTDRQVAVTVYRTAAHPTIRLDGYALQVRTRGLPDDTLDVDELAGPIATALLAVTGLDLGDGLVIDQIRFRSSMPMGFDAQNRWERSDNFDLDICPPPDPSRTT